MIGYNFLLLLMLYTPYFVQYTTVSTTQHTNRWSVKNLWHKFKRLPESVVVTTWNFSGATRAAWDVLTKNNGSAVDAVLAGCGYCETEQCDFTVGFGGSPDEKGDTTLDAMLFEGDKMRVGAVGALGGIKNAIGVAKAVALYTYHTILVGRAATDFAVQMGFSNESLKTNRSLELWKSWLNNKCQPNFWKNVKPDPTDSCGPYRSLNGVNASHENHSFHHDTIGQIAMSPYGSLAVGTSSNGAQHKITGRVGDASVPGSGGFVERNVGAAVATGDGDVMMRFGPAALVVRRMSTMSPDKAARSVVKLITSKFPNFKGAILALNTMGNFSAACSGFDKFSYSAAKASFGGVKSYHINCLESKTIPSNKKQ